MYKYLLCWRYLRTRYIALASIVSVMLGVATMIVVNAVMAGFAERMNDRLHGILADIQVESIDMDGFSDVKKVMDIVKQTGGDDVVAMAPTMETLGIIKFEVPSGKSITRPVQIIGINPEDKAACGDFAEYLFRANNQGPTPIKPSFEVPVEIRERDRAQKTAQVQNQRLKDPDSPFSEVDDIEGQQEPDDPGIILGYALATIHVSNQGDFWLAQEGGKVTLTFMGSARDTKPEHERYTVVGAFKSGMSEYDALFAYVPLEHLQRARGLVDDNGAGNITHLQIKVREGVNIDELSAKLRGQLDQLSPRTFSVLTWEQKQGPLLQAVAMEQGILNVLLFMIIAVAGFGILATFFMIVVEKTKDVGILKSLGASNSGVRGIFLGYGLSLGLVGSGVGMVLGLLFVRYINEIEAVLSYITGSKVFNPDIYYFNEIPTLVDPQTVLSIVCGALFIATAASVWPAQRAAKLHPVEALRY